MTLLWFAMACGPKQPVQEAPIVGWNQEETWTLACFHPPQYDTMLEMERRDSWQGSMDAMLQQWGGQRETEFRWMRPLWIKLIFSFLHILKR